MSSDTRPNEDTASTSPAAERVTAKGTNNVAVGGHVNDATIITGDGNQIGHRAEGDVVVGEKTVIHNDLSLKWLSPFLLVIAIGVCVIAWQVRRTGLTEEKRSHSLASPTPVMTLTPSPTATPTPTPTLMPPAKTGKNKAPAKQGPGVIIVDQKVEKK